MSTISKQWLQQKIADMEATRDDIPFGLGEDGTNTLAALRIALASLEAEPVAWLLSGGGAKNNVSFDSGNAYADPLREVTPLYTAPPAPVALTSGYSDFEEIWSSSTHPLTQDDEMKDFAWDIWNACRAAMLQGAEPASNRDELPLDYLQGHKDGLEWAAQLAEANHPQTGDWLYDDQIDLARAIRKGPDMPTVQGGNSPVIPDGWVACVERMPSAGEKVLAYRPDAPESNDPLIKMATYVGGSAHGHGFDCYCKPTHWMPLPAAPQQEVK
ncbi:TPA: DUF551 domain-containing protein [Escherichia coli]|uniref:DUF551 domain-containing protein n=1 Tax=Escherichia coli TaxID=562 RepID=UPI0019F08B90|nr:DUF551 domain-containing protein [Escherichia coli]EGO3805374.1 DUF551 domain-containing protein [Escherichia coli]MDO1888231.1 DUF551 domain-containing protein [Escherichia coli]MDT4631960.1 DUF551 domain-containing protein [Escherichia coli]HCT6230191.1 DUF551 domain-containing protein [Escherichia coli]